MEPEAKQPEIWTCPFCAQQLDISGIGFYTSITCTNCGHSAIVHDHFANFEIDGVVGVGGMSVVLHAKDRVLDRTIAIKVLNETYRNQPERIERFERECAMMAKVRHENVVDVYSAGWEGDQFYIAMELVDGQDLEGIVSKQGPLRQTDALEYARQVALGLQAARKAGLLHRDMKPGNVLITQDGKAKVLDFGLAMTQRDEDSEEVIWATPYYVAPETLFRDEEDVRTDIYSLGMTIRYLLTGVDTFSDQPVQSIPELAQFKEQMPSIRAVCPYLNDSLADLVDHMTQYNAKDRPLSYDSLLREMEDVALDLSQDDVLDSPEGKRRVRQRIILAGTATLGAGICAAAITALLVDPPPVQGYLDAGVPLHWPVYEQGGQCLAELSAKGGDSKDSFAALAGRSSDPGMTAWAALHACALASMKGDQKLVQEMTAVYKQACASLGKRTWVNGSLPASLLDVMGILTASPQDAIQRCKTFPSPALRGLSLLILKQETAQAMAAFNEAGAPYTALVGDSVPAPEPQPKSQTLAQKDGSASPAPPSQPNVKMVESPFYRDMLPKELYNTNDFAAIKTEAQKKMQQFPDEGNQVHSRMKVVTELCDVLALAFERIEQKSPGLLARDTTPEQVRDKLKPMSFSRQHFAEEVYSMLLLLRGQPVEAQKANPLGSSTKAGSDHFAVMMADWMQRYQR